MNEYKKNQLDEANALAALVQSLGHSTEVQAGDDTWVPIVVMDGKYRVMKMADGNITVSEWPYKHYETISSSKKGEAYTNCYTSNKMRVPTAKKLNERIADVDRYTATLDAMEIQNIEKHHAFLETLANIDGVAYTRVDDKITGGYITRNGMQFEFELCNDGYVSKKVKLHWTVPNTLEAFMALSSNDYKPTTNNN